MELGRGLLPGGQRYSEAEPLLERTTPQVALGNGASHGMGLTAHATGRIGATPRKELRASETLHRTRAGEDLWNAENS